MTHRALVLASLLGALASGCGTYGSYGEVYAPYSYHDTSKRYEPDAWSYRGYPGSYAYGPSDGSSYATGTPYDAYPDEGEGRRADAVPVYPPPDVSGAGVERRASAEPARPSGSTESEAEPAAEPERPRGSGEPV